MMLRIVDLFCGIGGMRLGFEKACVKMGIEYSCVFASDIDKNACKVYRANFVDNHNPLCDITKIRPLDIPDFDVCLAGFPCQAFSIAGRREGFDDARGTLFFNLATILEAKKPVAFLFENVKGLVHHDGGKTLKRLMEILEGLGYCSQYSVINSKNFGVPQNRPRVYLVGFRGFGGGFEWPKETDSKKKLGDILETEPVDPKFYLSTSYWETLVRHRKKQEEKGHGFGYSIKTKDGIASTIMCGGMGRERNLIVDKSIGELPEGVNNQWVRTMTPTEWERLQGYSDGWSSAAPDSIRMNLLGNSVTVNVIEAISKKLLQEFVNQVGSDTSIFA